MRFKQFFALVLVPVAMSWTGGRMARAQVSTPPLPSPPPLALEYSGATPGTPVDPYAGTTAPGTVDGRPVTPSPQGLDARSFRGHPAPKPLTNPFDGATSPAPHGHWVPSKASGAPVPMASGQTLGPPYARGRTGVGQLRNPFDPGYSQPPRGLFQQPSPQALPIPPVPPPPGVMPGAEPGALPGGVPAPGVAPEAEGVPGAPALPSPTPGAGAPEAALPGAAIPSTLDEFGAPGTGTGVGFGGTLQAGGAPFLMIGDVSPLTLHSLATGPPGPPPPPSPRAGAPVYSAVRTFKISENQSPRPQDRVFFSFNYYNGVNNAINSHDLSPVTQMKAYIYNFGFEKTFNNGMGSVGIRLPLDNLTANSYLNSVSTPTSTALGNMTIFAKYILAQNIRTGSLVSACWAISPQNATSRFAGAPYLFPLTSTNFQTCIAYICNYNRWYFQGFTGFNFSMNPNDVSWFYNDIGVGYYVMRSQDPTAWLTAVAPTFEVHVNAPVNHRDWFNRSDIAGTPDSVNFTYGLNFAFRNTAILTCAFVNPVTAPRPFDSEAVVMLNIFFGRTRRTLPITPPPL